MKKKLNPAHAHSREVILKRIRTDLLRFINFVNFKLLK